MTHGKSHFIRALLVLTGEWRRVRDTQEINFLHGVGSCIRPSLLFLHPRSLHQNSSHGHVLSSLNRRRSHLFVGLHHQAASSIGRVDFPTSRSAAGSTFATLPRTPGLPPVIPYPSRGVPIRACGDEEIGCSAGCASVTPRWHCGRHPTSCRWGNLFLCSL